MDTHSILALLLQLASFLPLMLIYCVGFVLAAIRPAHQRRFARLCMAGFGCHLLGVLISAGVQLWITYAAQTDRLSSSDFRAFGAVHLLVLLISITGWVLLLVALFSPRPSAEQETSDQ